MQQNMQQQVQHLSKRKSSSLSQMILKPYSDQILPQSSEMSMLKELPMTQRKEEFMAEQKKKFLLESTRNQQRAMKFLEDKSKTNFQMQMMHERFPTPDSFRGSKTHSITSLPQSTTTQFPSRILDETVLVKKQRLRKTFETNIYAKMDALAFNQTQLNLGFKKEEVKSSPVLVDNSVENHQKQLKIIHLTPGVVDAIGSTTNYHINEAISQSSAFLLPSLSNTQSLQQLQQQPFSIKSNGFHIRLNTSALTLNKSRSNSNLITPTPITKRSNEEQGFNRTSATLSFNPDVQGKRSPSQGKLSDRSSLFSNTSVGQKQAVSQNHFIRGQLGKRQDAREILLYMEGKINEFGQEGITNEELFVQKQNVYVSCFEELTRQISVDCRDQAVVLEEIWNNMMDLMMSIFVHIDSAKNIAEKSFAKKISSMTQYYTDLVNDFTSKVARLSTQVKERNTFIEKQVAENRYLRKKDRKTEKLYKLQQIEITCLQDELNMQIREHLKYLMSHEELTWREALDYQRRYYELTHQKRPTSLKNIKQISLEAKQQLDQNEIVQKMDMEQIINEFVIDPMESELQEIIEQADQNIEIATMAEISKQIDDADYIDSFLMKAKSTQTEDLVSKVDASTGTDETHIQIENARPIYQVTVTPSHVHYSTQTEAKDILMPEDWCTCEVQTDYTGDIRDIRIDAENWDRDLSDGFYERFNKQCAQVETDKIGIRSMGVQTSYEIKILIPQEAEIELDSLRGNNISQELKRIVEQGIQKQHISTDDLYECKQLIEQKIELQERLVRKVKDSYIRHKKAELEKELLQGEIELEMQFAKNQSHMQLSQLQLLSEDYKKFCNTITRAADQQAFEVADEVLPIAYSEFDRNQDASVSVEKSWRSQSNMLSEEVKVYSNSTIKEFSETALKMSSPVKAITTATQKSSSELNPNADQAQFKKRFSNHQTIQPATTGQISQVQMIPKSKRTPETSLNATQRTSKPGIITPNTSIAGISNSRKRSIFQNDEDPNEQSSEFPIPSLKDIEKDESYTKHFSAAPQGQIQAAGVGSQGRAVKQSGKQNQIGITNASTNSNLMSGGNQQVSQITSIPFSQLSRVYQKTTSIHTEAANSLIIEMSRKFSRGDRSVLNKKKYLPFINKTLSMVYGDIIKFVRNNNALNPLHVVTYESFIHRFGLRKVAEQKMIQEVEQAMLMAPDAPRLRAFIRMFYAQEGEHSTSEDKIEELKFFMNALILLDESKQAMGNFNVDRTATSTVRVHESLPKIFAEILPEKQIIELLSKLIEYPHFDVAKEHEYKRIPLPSYQKLDIDSVLDRLLEIYHNRFEILKSQYDALFKPLQFFDSIDVKDFMLLLRCIHDKDEWEFKKEIGEFGRRSESGKMNFYVFVSLCQKLGVLSESKQVEFLDEMDQVSDGQDAIRSVKDIDLYMNDVWADEKARLKLVLSANHAYTNSHKKLCDIIDAYLSKQEYYEVIHPKQTFMAYKILQKSVQITFVKTFTDNLLGNELSLINSMMRNFTFFGRTQSSASQQQQGSSNNNNNNNNTSTNLSQFVNSYTDLAI